MVTCLELQSYIASTDAWIGDILLESETGNSRELTRTWSLQGVQYMKYVTCHYVNIIGDKQTLQKYKKTEKHLAQLSGVERSIYY